MTMRAVPTRADTDKGALVRRLLRHAAQVTSFNRAHLDSGFYTDQKLLFTTHRHSGGAETTQCDRSSIEYRIDSRCKIRALYSARLQEHITG